MLTCFVNPIFTLLNLLWNQTKPQSIHIYSLYISTLKGFHGKNQNQYVLTPNSIKMWVCCFSYWGDNEIQSMKAGLSYRVMTLSTYKMPKHHAAVSNTQKKEFTILEMYKFSLVFFFFIDYCKKQQNCVFFYVSQCLYGLAHCTYMIAWKILHRVAAVFQPASSLQSPPESERSEPQLSQCTGPIQ